MSDINPQNYKGASAVVVGYTAGEARTPGYDKDGSSGVLEISMYIDSGYKKGDEFVKTGTTLYVYSAAGDYAGKLRGIAKGSKVRIDNAKIDKTRSYANKENENIVEIALRYGDIQVLEQGRANGGGNFAPDTAGTEAAPW